MKQFQPLLRRGKRLIMRRKKHYSTENSERWLVSYADFITLLFAFFVVLFASTQSDRWKAKAVSQAIDKALNHSSMAAKVMIVFGGSRRIEVWAIHSGAGPAAPSRPH